MGATGQRYVGPPRAASYVTPDGYQPTEPANDDSPPTGGGALAPSPKPSREIDETFLDFVREQNCSVCHTRGHGLSFVQAHHLKTRATGGSDYTATPLCAGHHSEWHQLGDRKFSEAHGVNLWRVNADLLRRYIGERLRRTEG